jgi:hypothetical protein
MKTFYGLAAIGAIGVAAMATLNPKPLPPPKTIMVERLAPVVQVPKAAVKPAKKTGKHKQRQTGKALKAPKAAPRGAQQDFAADLRKLKDCTVLKQLAASGKEPRNNYETKLRDALKPWYLRNCLFQ